MFNPLYTIISQDDGTASLALFMPGITKPTIHSSHPSYKTIVKGLLDKDESIDYVALFNAEEVVRERFSRLSDRVTVANGTVQIDGDPVDGTLEQQIIDFMEAGENFQPLVNFYERLLTNPLGDVKRGIYDWIAGQTAEGALTITPEGTILGYKGVWPVEGKPGVYQPSTPGAGTVNDVPVPDGSYIEQKPGDVVGMARSRVLHAPSAACGVGLHIGTWTYAKGFGPETLLVEFDPRDVVSVPDSNSVWKLRVCRYKVVKVVDEPLDVPVWHPEATAPEGNVNEGDFNVGDRVIDLDGDEGVIVEFDGDGDPVIRYDDSHYGTLTVLWTDLEGVDDPTPEVTENDRFRGVTHARSSDGRNHGKGGKHSRQAEGRGLNPNQDATTGQFVAGRPGSSRNRKGQFTS